MRTDKDLDALGNNDGIDMEDDMQEDSLEWLLDMEDAEQEDSLFKVEGDVYRDEGLTEYEAQVASRPMTRGNAGGDDLENYVAEEIVISSEGANSDIYGVRDERETEKAKTVENEKFMAVEFTRGDSTADSRRSSVEEGADIFGLDNDDDIGETQLTIKRVKKTPASQTTAASAEITSNDMETAAATEKGERVEQPETLVARDTSHVDLGEEQPMIGVGSSAQSVAAAVGTDVTASTLGDFEDSLGLDLDGLEEAPVTSQVADPQTQTVANESVDINAMDLLGEGDSVLDYVADAQKHLDDTDFDEMLLAAETLSSDEEMDFDDLAIEESEDVLSLDTSEDFSIDFHEDFKQVGDASPDSAANFAMLIPAVMQELQEAAKKRMTELGQPIEHLHIDALPALDDAAAAQCIAQGFAPISQVLTVMPAALGSLEPEQATMLFVRLVNTEHDDANWNSLFDAGFSPDSMAEEPAAAEPALVDPTPVEESSMMASQADDLGFLDDEDDFDFGAANEASAEEGLDGFGDDVFGDAFAAEMDNDPDALDSDFGADMDLDAAFTAMAAEGESVDDDLLSNELGALDHGLDEVTEGAVTEEAIAQVQPVQVEAKKYSTSRKPARKASQPETAAGKDRLVVHAGADAADISWCIPKGVAFSKSSENAGDIFADFLDAFIEEGSAEIERLEDLVSEWEKDPANEDVQSEIARRLHTVKGIAKGVGLQRFGTLIHNFETLLDAVASPEKSEEQTYFRMVNVWLDAVVRGIDHVTEARSDIASELPVSGSNARQKPQAPVEPTPQEKAERAAEADKQADQLLADEGAKALASQQSVRITSEKLDHLLNLASQSQQLCVRASQTTTRSKRSTLELQGRLSSVRTHIGKIADRALLSVSARGNAKSELDALEMDQYSELQEAASILREGVEDLGDLIELLGRQNTQVEVLLKQQSSVISSISSSIQNARVVPVSRLMPGLRRIVRTVSTDLGKVVTFRVLKEVGALDRDHYARLQVALEHMVRNALDHGIESPEERLAAGKTESGRITIDVNKSGGDYVIRLSDDGKGIDPDGIRASAAKKGLEVDGLTDEQAVNLIFHKGFSTATQVSEISGRGVGMDIVLSELQQIGGDVKIESKVGQGTTFVVRIPSNVTVNGALMVTAADSSYAIPLNGLIAVEQVPADEYFAAVHKNETLRLFDMDCEPSYLATLCERVPLPERTFWESFVPVIIAGTDDRHMAIAIDNVQEALELVVRSLGNQFSNVPGLAGAATTSDGEAIIALDLNLLVQSVGEDGAASVAVEHEESSSMLALVVDDSRTQRMVATSQLDTVGVETVTAENGQVAIDLLNATHRLPDVVLLDVEMPVKDGIETLREIRKSQRYGHIPVIMVTSRTGTKHRAMAKEAGCNAYMGKPFNFPAMVEQINVLTGHNLQLS
jgi:chemosensory pili system protein ChpA (sensor histidine kinase/response regulator)